MKAIKKPFARESAIYLVLIICVSIFLSELTLMFALYGLTELSRLHEALINSSLLVVAVFPAVYFFAFRPLRTRLAESKQMAQQLRDSEARYRLLVNSLSDALISADSDGNIVGWNTSAERLFGYTESEILGQPLTLLMPARFHDDHKAGMARMLSSGEHHVVGTTVELEGRRKDGSEFPLELSRSEWRVADKTFFTGLIRDITGRKDAAAELLETNRYLEAATARANELAVQAELASSAKSEFLASMSHEIRTPMNGVMGMLGLLQDTELTERQREFVQIAHSSADALLNIINDILDFSKIEAGKLTIEPVPFDLQTAVEEVGELLAPKVAEKGLDIIVRFAPGTPRHIVGDPGRVRQVLTNLVGNAIKFTAKGHVLINIQCETKTETHAQIIFSVEDTGIGIPPDKLERIFEKFTQADASTTRRFGGTGLGLAISKQLIELMGGKIAVTSLLDKGSTFWFVLPFDRSREPVPAAPVRTLMEGARALIVDDNEANRRVLHEQLTGGHVRNDNCASGEEALAKLREAHAAGDPYQMALLDYQMPGMDGEMLARAIKTDTALRATSILVLTSMGSAGLSARLKELGVFTCLLKPVRQQKLWDVLAEAWETHTRQAPVELLTRAATAKPATDRKIHARVLVVDDNATNQKVGRLMLENLGCRVDVAASGKEAVEMLALLPYDVVFMDCEMPDMDGYEATAEIRRRHANVRHVPIIAMTAKAIQGDRERCLAAGMDDYISKPIDPHQLNEVLQRYLSAPSSTAVFDEADLLARTRVDHDLLCELIETYICDAESVLAKLDAALRANDTPAARVQAHALKGSSGSVSMMEMQQRSAQLEDMLLHNNLAGAQTALPELRAALKRARASQPRKRGLA